MDYIEQLEQRFQTNKAKGVLTELLFRKEFPDRHIYDGCWLLVQKGHRIARPQKYAVFVFPEGQLQDKITEHKPVFKFLLQHGIHLALACLKGDGWVTYHYNFKFEKVPDFYRKNFITFREKKPFLLEGQWEPSVRQRYADLPEQELKDLWEKQMFVYQHLRGDHNVWVDVHDIDGFVREDGQIKLLEIKEKSTSQAGWIGIDINKIMMLVFFKLQGQYIVRQVDKDASRAFLKWLSIDCQEIIQHGGWTIATGGPSMYKGAETQTISIPYDLFTEIKGQIVD